MCLWWFYTCRFVDDLISRFSDNAALMTAFAFFVTPTATDVATKVIAIPSNLHTPSSLSDGTIGGWP